MSDQRGQSSTKRGGGGGGGDIDIALAENFRYEASSCDVQEN